MALYNEKYFQFPRGLTCEKESKLIARVTLFQFPRGLTTETALLRQLDVSDFQFPRGLTQQHHLVCHGACPTFNSLED